MTICVYVAFYCKIVFCSIIRKNQLSGPPLVLISLDSRRSTVIPFERFLHLKVAIFFNGVTVIAFFTLFVIVPKHLLILFQHFIKFIFFF